MKGFSKIISGVLLLFFGGNICYASNIQKADSTIISEESSNLGLSEEKEDNAKFVEKSANEKSTAKVDETEKGLNNLVTSNKQDNSSSDANLDERLPKRKFGKDIEVIFVLDESGSMDKARKSVIDGYNNFIKEQQEIKNGDIVRITTVIFSDTYRVLHNRADMYGLRGITKNDYCPNGCTALYDAVGCAINLGQKVDGLNKEIMVIIMTDGYENSSREYSYEKLSKLTSDKKGKNNWTFKYLMSGINKYDKKASIGVDIKDTMSFESARENHNVGSKMLTCACDELRSIRSR